MNKRAFSLLEILSVLAVVAILAAMLIPAISGARRQFNIVQTKAQLQRYILGLENYRAHYGAYPALGQSPILINATPAFFVELLTAKSVNGSTPTTSLAISLNPDGLSFADFTSSEITAEGKITDSFGNTNIELFIDYNSDGFLDGLTNVRGRVGFRSGSISTW